MYKGSKKERLNKQRQDFLLTFFNKPGYDFKEVNGFILERHWNGDSKVWQVAIYTKEMWEKRQGYTEGPLDWIK